MHGRGCAWGHAWQGAGVAGVAYMAEGDMAGGGHGRGHAWQERWPLPRAVCILLEFILVAQVFVYPFITLFYPCR